MTITHRKAVDRVRSAEAASRRDTTYHDTNQTVDHDSTADAAETRSRPVGCAPRSPA